MRIETKSPYVRRGVTQLMYVGNDDAVDGAIASGKSGPDLVRIAKIVGVVWVAMWMVSGISPPAPRATSRRPSWW